MMLNAHLTSMHNDEESTFINSLSQRKCSSDDDVNFRFGKDRTRSEGSRTSHLDRHASSRQ